MTKTILTLLSAVAFLSACGDDSTGPGSDDSNGTGSAVTIKFGAAGSTPSPSASFSRVGAAAPQDLSITGSNGTLAISDIRLIVEEFELEPVEVADCDVEPEPAGCADFKQRYFLIDVPLEGAPLTVVTAAIPAGMYDELEFEVDDVEIDADDPEEAADAALIQALFAQARAAYPDWPEKASMVVVGTFTPADGGDAIPFRTYFEAEIDVELEFTTPLVVTEGMSEGIVIEVSPSLWFSRADGTVWNLSEFNYADTQELIEFELEIDDGFDLEIET